MKMPFRAIARSATAVPATLPLRSFERQIGLLALATMFFLALMQPLSAHEFKAGDISVDHPWSRATPAGAKVAVGYLVIRNAGSAPDRLVSVTSEIADKAEVHEMAVDANGVMTMRPLAGTLEIAAGDEAELKPGSYHLMFMGLKRPVKEGEAFPATLSFENAGTVDVEFTVQAIGGSAGHGGHDGH
ncbi:copper chaperone PCu(A)C [Pseudaminobacter sp. NGMCC 1.201702]|uniref:copper chaperone PCu(A)C n=1 Tax=Pseudaminobacter sp. NGMCC 1.201702 TaxID=3391825 RepID=UPI0039EE5D9E